MIGLPSPYLALGCALALASAGGVGFMQGSRFAHGQDAIAKNKALEQAIADKDAAELRISTLESAAAEREQNRQSEVREIVREIPTIARDPVYQRVCVDDAGVRALDRAARAANGGDAGAAASGSGQASDTPPHN